MLSSAKAAKKVVMLYSARSLSNQRKCKPVYAAILNNKKLSAINETETVLAITKETLSHLPFATIYREIATFLLNVGQPGIARDFFMLSIKECDDAGVYSLYLQCLLLDGECDDKEMYENAIQYNRYLSHVRPYTKYDNTLDPNKKLNIGYICHFFNNSVSQSLLLPFLRAHDRNHVKVFCYSDTEPHDVPDSVKNIADVWRETKSYDDKTMANLIREDGIDILLELNGHIIVNRYGVIARKPAPIQISYYNQAATTGIFAIDYLLVGEQVTIDEKKGYYAEKIYSLPGPPGIAEFADRFPPVSLEPPCIKNGYITFGSFGASQKVNREVIKTWCEILKRLPNSKLFFKATSLSLPSHLAVYQRAFANEGMDLSRIRFEGFSEHNVMLEKYAEVDIALDTFPHAAGTTTMEATWQGVPVVTLCGERYRSQNGKVVHATINHLELVTYSKEDYINKAITLANDPKALFYYRKELRNSFKQSALCDAKGHASRLEAAYRDMWQQFCRGG